MIDLHVSIDNSLHNDLIQLAEREKSNEAEIVRRALENYIQSRQQQKTYGAMRSYAEIMSTHSKEFVTETDETVSEQLLSTTDW
jgi:metal-responsive CopG/Arc/MetJ family transcriptional regulator